MSLPKLSLLKIAFAALVLFQLQLQAQTPSLYFPPKAGNTWQTTSPESLGFCPERIDSLYHFLETRQTKSFLLLKDGKMVLEKYFGTFVQDSIWYWASAGKSLTGFMVGQAQEAGLLSIEDQTSQYLGLGWTSAAADKEALIKIRHQLTMTNGLDDTFVPTPAEPDPNTCKDPECLLYLADAGTRWAYHTGPYRLLHDVLAEASGLTINSFTKTYMFDRTGMKGLWVGDVFYSKARDMARFGLLTLAEGVWDGDTLLHDRQYFEAMTHTSQSYNKSYGYLWWLNGQQSFMVPGLQLVIPGKMIPNAPNDMIAALGKNDQKIHVIPSKGWVVVRQGNSGSYTNGAGDAVPIVFDNAMWSYLNQLECAPVATNIVPENESLISIFPNPAPNAWNVQSAVTPEKIELFNAQGTLLGTFVNTPQVDATRLPAGHYWLKIYQQGKIIIRMAQKQP